MNMTVPLPQTAPISVSSDTASIAKIADLAVDTFTHRGSGMPAHSLTLLANSVDRLLNVAPLDHYQIMIACGQSAARMHGPNNAMV